MQPDDYARETYRLTLENNRMLHKMRRNAFWGGLIKFLIYAAFLLVPVWLYFVYMAPIVDRMLSTVQQIQGTSVQAQTQLTNWQEAWKEFQAKFTPSKTP